MRAAVRTGDQSVPRVGRLLGALVAESVDARGEGVDERPWVGVHGDPGCGHVEGVGVDRLVTRAGAPHRPISNSAHALVGRVTDTVLVHWRSRNASCAAYIASSAIRGDENGPRYAVSPGFSHEPPTDAGMPRE